MDVLKVSTENQIATKRSGKAEKIGVCDGACWRFLLCVEH